MIIAAHDAEQTLVGSLLVDPDVLDDVQAIVQPDDLTDHRCRRVFEIVARLRDDREPATLDAVLISLRRHGGADDLGPNPAAYLADLWSRVPTAATAEFAAREVRDAAMRRHAAALAVELVRDANSPVGPADELIEMFLGKLASVAESRSPLDEPEPVGVGLRRAGMRYDDFGRGEGARPITTGFPEVDRVLAGGLRPEELVYVAARTGKGKSIYMRQVAVTAAEAGHPSLWFGLEMSTDETVDRIVADKTRIPLARLRGASKMSADEAMRVVELTERYSKLPFYMDQRKRLSVAQIARSARRMVRKRGVKLIAIDYLQLLQPENRKAARYEQVGQISRDLKVLAAELKIVVVAAVQVSREAARGEIELHHLRESGSLEQDGNIVLILNPQAGSVPAGELKPFQLKVAKQRSGQDEVVVNLVLNGKYTRFEPAGIPL